MKALVLNGTQARVVDNRPIPKLRDDYILVKTVAVALNPTDSKAISQGRAAPNGLAGCDFAGTVEEVGSKVTKPWKKGDRVFGSAHGANGNNPEDGTFAEIITVKGDVVMRIPDNMSFEDASTIAVTGITCGQGLFQQMKLNWPTKESGMAKEYILIYGGSSSCGTLAIQYAKLAGYSVITTCSPKNNDLVKSRGAEAVFDYSHPDCGQQIYDYTKGNLQLVWDTIGSEQGVQICMKALSTNPGSRYGTVLFNSIPRQDVMYTSSFLMTFLGEAFDKFGKHMPASEEDFEFAKMFTALTEQLLAEGKLKPHPARVQEGGLNGILDGVKLMLSGNVSGEKFVYRIADTA